MTIKAINVLNPSKGVIKESPGSRVRECRYACKNYKQVETRNAQQ
ncbi:hypothetical protein PMI22_05513 [Pseudomonas sp. GM21]|jgi:hypothetical protein|nr:hypothetical protein PMI22_05513 [Pseudomonas sp. GM21]MDR6926985.1 hypothetical protein [Pseudomonas sp. BE134]MDR7284993.1 hypothetical protein [Pseudomonas corrugata]